MQTNSHEVSADDLYPIDPADDTLKLHLLNTSLIMLAYPAFLAGYRTVREAINDNLFTDYLNAFVDQDVSPLLALESEADLAAYKSGLLSHLANPAVSSHLMRLCSDGASKLPAFILPVLRNLLDNNKDVHRIAFLVAAYGHYLSASHDDQGITYEVDDPHLRQEDWTKINNSDVVALLGISPLASARLHTFSYFVTLYKSYRAQIAQLGVVFLLKQMAYHRLAMR